jgi:hypothetical protein
VRKEQPTAHRAVALTFQLTSFHLTFSPLITSSLISHKTTFHRRPLFFFKNSQYDSMSASMANFRPFSFRPSFLLLLNLFFLLAGPKVDLDLGLKIPLFVMSFFQALPGIHKTWVWAWEWWTSRKASKAKGKAVELERAGSGRGGERAQLVKLKQDLTDLRNRVVILEF